MNNTKKMFYQKYKKNKKIINNFLTKIKMP